MTRIIAIIQARMGSTRFPGKVLKEICGKPIICHIVERAKQAKTLSEVIVATSTNSQDDLLYDYLLDNNITCIRGSEDDVLGRYFESASQVNADIIVRLTGDNPLIDFKMIDAAVDYFNESKLSYVSTDDVPSISKPIPLGVGCEVFSYDILKEAFFNAHKQYEREHVTPYMYLNSSDKNKSILKNQYSYRLTVDTPEDFDCVSKIYELLYHGKHDFCTEEVIKCLESNQDIVKINSMIVQKRLGE